MKILLSAAALLAALSASAFAEEAAPVTAGTSAQTASAAELVPSVSKPAMSEAQPAAVSESPSQAASEGGCGHARKAVYLTN